MRPRVTAFGESALFVELGDVFDEALAAWARALADEWPLGLAVPAYASVTATFDPEAIDAEAAERRMRDLVERGPAGAEPSSSGRSAAARLVEIPTRYDGEDVADVAGLSHLSVDELIAVHSEREYTAIFLGFLPGFAYCGRLDGRIIAPRLERPRERVPAGAVAVADGQTGVYPIASPGGWRLLGVTDLVMFDPQAAEPATVRAGDRVRFVPR